MYVVIVYADQFFPSRERVFATLREARQAVAALVRSGFCVELRAAVH